MQFRKYNFFGWLLAIVLVGADLRLTRLDAESFWFDEAWTWTIIRGTTGEMLSRLSTVDAHPPLYFFLIQGWTSLFGSTETAMRAFSALLSIAAIPLMFLLASRLGGKRAGYVAAVFTAMSPYLVWYAKEARSYSLLFFLCLWSTVVFFDLLRSPSRRKWVLWAVLVAGVMYTHYMGGFFMIGTAAAAWSLRSEREGFLREFTVASAGAIVLYLPWVPFLVHHIRFIAYDFWMPQISLTGLLFAFCDLVANPGMLLNEGGHMLSIPFYVIAIRYASKNRRPLEMALLWLLLIPGLGEALISVVWKPVFYAPTFQFMLIPLFVLTALAVERLPRPGSTILAVALAALLFPALHHMQSSLHKEDWRGVTEFMDRRIQPGEVIIVDPGYVAMNLEYYGQDTGWRKKIVRIEDSDSIEKPFKRDYAVREILPNVPGVWLVFRYGRHLGWPKEIERNFEWRECLISRYIAAHHYVRR